MTSKKKFCVELLFRLLPLLLTPTLVLGEKVEGNTAAKSKNRVDYTLTIKEDFISLNAKDVSLKEIIEEIGHKMQIKVVGNISEEEKITVKFEKLSLVEAIKKLSKNYGYLMDSKKGEKKITKIFVLPKGKETVAPIFTAKEPGIHEREDKESKRPEPFKFEFDLSEFVNEGK